MLYMKGKSGDLEQHIVILETANIEAIKQGKPVISQDKEVLICWTPDPVWLCDKIMDTGGDGEKIAELIDESQKRLQKPQRPYHAPTKKKLS